MNNGKLKVLIVDDEPPARRKLRRFLEVDPGIAMIEEAGTGAEAIEAIEKNTPDLGFLDTRSGLSKSMRWITC